MRSRGFAIAALVLVFLSSPAAAQVPRTLSYQGVLTDSAGHTKADGAYGLSFRLYGSSSGGNALWTEVKTLTTSQGLFSTVLGDQVPLTLPFDGQYWLGVQIANDPELSPRIPLSSTPYSLHSVRSDTALFAKYASAPSSADSSRVAGTVPNNSITATKIQSGQIVKNLNGLKDSVTLAAGNNITITPNGHTLTVAATAGGLNLPFSSKTGNSNTLLSVTNNGTGGSASFAIDNSSDTSTVLRAITNGKGTGVYAQTSSQFDNVAAVVGVATATSGGASGLWGDASADPNGSGVLGRGGQAGGFFLGGNWGAFATTNTGTGLQGVTNSDLGGATGVVGIAATSNSATVIGVSGSAVNNPYGIGMRGTGRAVGVEGIASEPSGKAVRGEADGLGGTGVEGDASNGSNSYGVLGYSSNGYGGYFIGKFYQTSGTFEAHPTSTTWSTNKPATVKLSDGGKVKLFAEEAAEVYFDDYGEAALQNGRAHIQLDPRFMQTVTIDAAHPMKVFVQLEGDCKGVYVTNRSATGFDVVELQGGNSNVQFAYKIVCKRKYYEDERLATDQEDTQYNTRMLETAWPEVIAQQKVDKDRIARRHVDSPAAAPLPNIPGAKR